MKVILKQKYEKLGDSGGIVEVADGYARNFLIPKKIAMKYSNSSLKILEEEKRELGKILDFLSQELLRETNTILAKVKDKNLSLQAVYFKEEIDRIRELAQNIE